MAVKRTITKSLPKAKFGKADPGFGITSPAGTTKKTNINAKIAAGIGAAMTAAAIALEKRKKKKAAKAALQAKNPEDVVEKRYGGPAGKIPKGYHKMPDGTIMKDSAHKKTKKKK